MVEDEQQGRDTEVCRGFRGVVIHSSIWRAHFHVDPGNGELGGQRVVGTMNWTPPEPHKTLPLLLGRLTEGGGWISATAA